MNGPQHYTAAEELLDILENPPEVYTQFTITNAIAAAQVHATLALAAATAEPRHGRGIGRSDNEHERWQAVM